MPEPKRDPVSLLKSLSPETRTDLARFILANCRYNQESSRKEAEYLGSMARLHRKKLDGRREH